MAPHSPLPFFLLLLLLASITTTSSSSSPPPPKFNQAPLFHNSPSCPPPLPPSSASCSTSALAHIAMTLDAAYLRGSVAAIHSILHHSSCPQSLQFHFLATPSSLPHLSSTLSSTFPSLSFRIHSFDPSHVSSLISTSLRPALDQPLNYARSYLSSVLLTDLSAGHEAGASHQYHSCPSRVVYLDSDLILVDDIIDLYNTPFPDPDTVVAAPEHCNANLTNYFTPTFWSNALLSMAFEGRKRKACYFNTGVMVMDLGRWRDGGYTARVEEWMELQKRMRIYELGSLPPFLLEFAGRVGEVDERWNQHGLGGDNRVGSCRELHPGKASLLHWSGKGKPWKRIDEGRPCPLDAIWAEFDLIHNGRRSSSFDRI